VSIIPPAFVRDLDRNEKNRIQQLSKIVKANVCFMIPLTFAAFWRPDMEFPPICRPLPSVIANSNWITNGLKRCLLVLIPLSISSPALIAATTSTTTSLSLSSQSVSSGSPVTFRATVTSGGTPVRYGEVAFCNAALSHCVGDALLGTAQVNSTGTASIIRVLSPGSHGVYAIYRGTLTNGSSSSENTKQTVTVQAKSSPTLVLTGTGNSGDTHLTATLTGHSEADPTGTISFLNAANNQVVTIANLATTSTSQSFTAAGSYPTGTNPNFAAVGDFNNDGRTDLAISNNNDASVSVFLADPANPGKFQAGTKYSISGLPNAITVGDFNADGVLDLAIANSTYLSILLGDPNNPGKFQSEATYSFGHGLGSITVGDFNGDGLPDLAMTDLSFSYVVHIALNDGTQPGHFLQGQTISTDFGTISAVARDLNGDGLSDLLLASNSEDRINVLLADSAHPGQFLTAVNYPTFFQPTGMALADFNGDGVLDIAAIEESNTIDLFLGDPAQAGQFQSPKEITTNDLSYDSVTAADFNGDGLVDLGLITEGSSNITVLLGDSTQPGQFLPQVTYPSGSGSPAFLTSADFNADGIPDLAVVDSNNDDLSILLGSVTKVATATAAVSSTSLAYVAAEYLGDDAYSGLQSCVLSLANLSSVGPVISGINVSNITSNAVTIQWTTNIPTNDETGYGSTPSLRQYTPWPYLPSTTHSVVLNGLQPSTKYDYQIDSVAFSNGCSHWSAISPLNSFTTAQ
jgi:VCBS repeat protein/Big-like domain-containing protein/FG-GAP repeat protein